MQEFTCLLLNIQLIHNQCQRFLVAASRHETGAQLAKKVYIKHFVALIVQFFQRFPKQRNRVFDCAVPQQKEILDAIAYRANALKDPGLAQGVAFFALLRNLTADGFFTSEIGIKYLGYIGNKYMADFLGCPPVPDV